MALRPLDDRILVRLSDVAVQTRTAGGLYIPDTAKQYRHRLMRRGRVVACGTKVTLVRPGDEVTFTQQDGFEVPEWPDEPHADKELRMVREKELEGVIEDAEIADGCVICGHVDRAEAAE